MDPIVILYAGLATGTILLFAAIGEVFAERSGVMNLGVEGMMLLGAMAGFSVSLSSGNVWLGLAAAMIAGGILSLAAGRQTTEGAYNSQYRKRSYRAHDSSPDYFGSASGM